MTRPRVLLAAAAVLTALSGLTYLAARTYVRAVDDSWPRVAEDWEKEVERRGIEVHDLSSEAIVYDDESDDIAEGWPV